MGSTSQTRVINKKKSREVRLERTKLPTNEKYRTLRGDAPRCPQGHTSAQRTSQQCWEMDS